MANSSKFFWHLIINFYKVLQILQVLWILIKNTEQLLKETRIYQLIFFFTIVHFDFLIESMPCPIVHSWSPCNIKQQVYTSYSKKFANDSYFLVKTCTYNLSFSFIIFYLLCQDNGGGNNSWFMWEYCLLNLSFLVH